MRLITDSLYDDLEKFLGKIVFEIAYRPTKDKAASLISRLRENKNVQSITNSETKVS